MAMAATQYIVFYRHLNDFMSEPVTNDINNKYEELLEFYVDPDHKIFSDDPLIRSEEWTKQQEIISYGNNAMNPKNDMLFVYNGAEKVKHKKWIEDSIGYVVKDWTEIPRSRIGSMGDFTKDFTTINYTTPEDGGTVVCLESNMKKYMESEVVVDKKDTLGNPVYKTDRDGNQILDSKGKPIPETDNGKSIMKTVTVKGWYTPDEIKKSIEESSFWKLTSGEYIDGDTDTNNNFDYKTHGVVNYKKRTLKSSDADNNITLFLAQGPVYIARNDSDKKAKLVFTDNTNTGNPGTTSKLKWDDTMFAGTPTMQINTIHNRYSGQYKKPVTNAIEFESEENINNIYGSIVIRKEHIDTAIVPAHYEEVIDPPYLVKDVYQRVMATPWFVHCVCGSLNAALDKARQLAATHGIENVKLVKKVPIDHFIKIK